MDKALQELLQIVPPPSNAPYTSPDWEKEESEANIVFPRSFKDFVSYYGMCIWFDDVAILSPNVETLGKFRDRQINRLDDVKGKTLDEEYEPVSYKFYPDEGGLFPFLEDFSSLYYLWNGLDGSGDDPEVVVWNVGPTFSIGKLSIAEMMLGYIKKEERMVNLWGDIDEFDREIIAGWDEA